MPGSRVHGKFSIHEACEATGSISWTVAHVRGETDLLTGAVELPPTRASFRDRHVLIVVRGEHHRRDLKALNAYVRDVRPLVVAVDGGADGALEAGLKPDVILGDMDSASDAALRCGAELVVHAYPDGRGAPGRERLVELGLDHTVLPAAGTSEDVAMLMAYEKGAALIVSVGAHFNLIEFLDRKRGGMSSTFLTRLRIGEKLVDAKGVSRLYNPSSPFGPLVLFLAAFGLCIPAANWLIGHAGTVCVPQGPCLIPVAPGLMAPSGVLMIGLALVLRDLVQRRLGFLWAAGAILAGAALSALLAPPALVLASAVAFLLSEQSAYITGQTIHVNGGLYLTG